jgi:hypothetical protein
VACERALVLIFFMSGQGVEIAQGANQVPQTAREAVIAVNHDGINPVPAAIRWNGHRCA